MLTSVNSDCAKTDLFGKFTECRIEHRRIFISGARSKRHEHDGDDWPVTAAVLEANVASVWLNAARQHCVALTTLEDHVRQELLHTATAATALSALYTRENHINFTVNLWM